MNEFNQKRILLKALRKAIKNGYNPKTIGNYHTGTDSVKPGYIIDELLAGTSWSINDVLLSHDFAKSLWGSDMVESECKRQTMCFTNTMPLWAWKLMEMVVYPDLLDFLALELTATNVQKVKDVE